MKLVGIGIGNFLSIGTEPVWINLEKKVNVLIGANNSGKSNVIKCLLRLKDASEGKLSLQETERHQRDGRLPFRLSLRVRQDSDTNEIKGAPEILEFELEYQGGAVCSRSPFGVMDFPEFNKWLRDNGRHSFGARPSEQQLTEKKLEVG